MKEGYRGKFESGKPYNFTIFLTPKMGWIFDSEKEDLIKLEGGEILNHFVEFELSIQGVTKAVHNWKGATCTEPDRCKGCGVTQGKALGHAYDHRQRQGHLHSNCLCTQRRIEEYQGNGEIEK